MKNFLKNFFENLWECFILCCKIAVAYVRNAIVFAMVKCGKWIKWLGTALYFAVTLGVCVRIIKFIGGV